MLRVLLGSHEAGERHQWRQWLSEAPLEVVGLAQDGQEAVQLAVQLRPDLVLLDHALPVIDGFQAAGMISLATPGSMQVLVGPTDGPAVGAQRLERLRGRHFMDQVQVDVEQVGLA